MTFYHYEPGLNSILLLFFFTVINKFVLSVQFVYLGPSEKAPSKSQLYVAQKRTIKDREELCWRKYFSFITTLSSSVKIAFIKKLQDKVFIFWKTFSI